MYGELASVQGIVDLSPQEALDRAEGFLASQGYIIGQRTYTTLTAQRQAGGETGGEDLPNLTVALAPQPDGGVRITVRGNDQAGVQERQAAWIEWSESLPKKLATQIEEAGERTVEVPDAVLPPPPQAEADVSVPPAPQPEEEQKPRISLGKFLAGFLVLIVVIWLLIPTGGGSRSGGGSANSGGGSQAVAPDKAEQNDRADQPKPAPEPKPEPKPGPKPISLSGNASQATDFFELEEGLAVFDFSHQGQMNFVATLLDEQGKEVAYALGNEIGTFQSSSAVRIPKAGPTFWT